jgi:predicted Zn-dependent protease
MKVLYNLFRFISSFLILLLLSCAVNPVTGEKEFMLVTEDGEISFGRELYPNILWGEEGGGGIFRDRELEGYLGGIIKRIHSVSHRPSLPVDFVIQNSSVPNAWAIPGHVSITRGLLVNIENESQFAFVMGHEMGHVSARHSAKKMSVGLLQQLGIVVASAFIKEGKAEQELLLGLGVIGSSLLILKYDRGQELQADRLGVLYMARTGYDPNEAVTAHKNLDKAIKDYLARLGKSREESILGDLLSTHPRTQIRLDEVKAMIQNLEPYKIQGDGKFASPFAKNTAKIKETQKAYIKYDNATRAFRENNIRKAEDNISEALRMNQEQAPFWSFSGLIKLKQSRYDEAEKDFKVALQKDSEYQPAYHGLGLRYYLLNDQRSALGYFEKSLKLYPGHPGSNYYAGVIYYKFRNYKKAIDHLDNFEDVSPKHPDVHGYLGLSYEAIRDIEDAVNEYRAQIKVEPNNEMGRIARTRLKALEPYLQPKKK